MRIATFGKVTQDETIYLRSPIVTGGNAPVHTTETVFGGMVTWASRVIHNEGHTPVLFGCAGKETPLQHVGPRSEDRLIRIGNMHKIRVIVDPGGQRTFLSPEKDTYPVHHINEQDVIGISAAVVDGYSLLPDRNSDQATELVHAIRKNVPDAPVTITIPVAQKITSTAAQHLTAILSTWGSVYVCGGDDEHALLPDLPPTVTRVTTTGPTGTHVTLVQNGTLLHAEPVALVPCPTNTNGAGDTFAGALTLMLAHGAPLPNAVRYAHSLASAHVQRSHEEQPAQNTELIPV